MRRAQLKLAQLDQVGSVEELRKPPGNKLHKLGGDREGQWAIRINDQYRICFRFDNEAGDAYDVEATDYH
ncbi:MAG TPA: type II toxin-antitoxin system RelE/ParE family toxin [Rubrobacteraceae bacterium]|nr:type II toxin-antitoxin system RelE/ParE family toxin [Rubrobacteraceae bacterium]